MEEDSYVQRCEVNIKSILTRPSYVKTKYPKHGKIIIKEICFRKERLIYELITKRKISKRTHSPFHLILSVIFKNTVRIQSDPNTYSSRNS